MTRRTWYRIAIAILVLGEGYLLVSGRLAASYRYMGTPSAPENQAEFFYHFVTNVLWIAFLAPLGATVVWVATRDRSATAGAAYWRAIRTVFTVAWKGDAAVPLEEATDTVDEDPLGALLKGVATAALLPSFFWFAKVPVPHTARSALWLGLTGALFGASVYCLERARPFLTPSWHEAQRGRLFRRWWSPYPISYDPPGNRWIVWHWVFAILAGVCWVGGFGFVIGSSTP
jgi:hypothetical protein